MQEYDIPEILRIERASFSAPWSEAAFRQELHKHYALSRVAELRGKVVGYICVNNVLDDCHILNLSVDAEFRRQGLATALMKNTLNESREKGCRFFYLEVRVSNTEARIFYERIGFSVVGIRKKYYNFPIEDAAIMLLRA